MANITLKTFDFTRLKVYFNKVGHNTFNFLIQLAIVYLFNRPDHHDTKDQNEVFPL